MSAPFGFIGIDFGTSNSHFAHCISDSDPPVPETIRLGDKDSQTTCVLWKKPKQQTVEDPSLIADYGTMALYTWQENLMDGKTNGHFSFGFKPDLRYSEQARLDAWAFLHKAREEIRQAGLSRPINANDGYQVVVGVPAEIGEEHRNLTADIAKRAGFGDVCLVEEPLGALAYHLQKKEITPTEARAGVIVVDFGGGTLDIALVNAKGLREPWGDPTLGGRLFDDLFFQWVAEQNPGLEDQLEDGERLAVWQNDCRRLKEDFSARWRRRGDELNDFKGSIRVGGTDRFLRNASVEAFEKRARQYRPSLMLRRYMCGLDRLPAGLVMDTPIDLYDRIRLTLTNRGQLSGLRGQFSKVILTGGSCNWPFMRRMVADVFGVDANRDIIMSQNPETTIGSGLALYNVLRLRNEARRETIARHKPKAKNDFETALSVRLERYTADLSKAILDVLMPKINQVYENWYEKGGALNRVESRVQQICKDFERNEAETVVKRYWLQLNTDIVRLMRDHLVKFLNENEIAVPPEYYIPIEVKSIGELAGGAAGHGNRIVTDVGGLAGMAAFVGVFAMIGLLILAALKVKVIAAIVFASIGFPPLAIALGIAALVAAAAAGEQVQQVVEDTIKAHEFAGTTLWMLQSWVIGKDKLQTKLAEGRLEADGRLREAIRNSMMEPNQGSNATPIRQQSVETFDRIIDTVIQDLGVLEQIRRSHV